VIYELDDKFMNGLCSLIYELSDYEFKKGDIPTWKFSSKWSMSLIDCTKDGIISGCYGKCCTGATFWPSRLYDDKKCGFLTDKGCILKDDDKPVFCLLFPLMKNKNNTLNLYFRAKTSCCKSNVRADNSTTIIECLKDNIKTLLGEGNANYILNCVSMGMDPVVKVPKHIVDSLDREYEWENTDAKPMSRTNFESNLEVGKDSYLINKLKLIKSKEELSDVIKEFKTSLEDGHFKSYVIMWLEQFCSE